NRTEPSADCQSAIRQTASLRYVGGLRAPLLDCRQNVRHHFALRLRADVAFTMETNAHVPGVHVATADDEHGVDLRLLGFGNLRLDRVGTEIGFATDKIR